MIWYKHQVTQQPPSEWYKKTSCTCTLHNSWVCFSYRIIVRGFLKITGWKMHPPELMCSGIEPGSLRCSLCSYHYTAEYCDSQVTGSVHWNALKSNIHLLHRVTVKCVLISGSAKQNWSQCLNWSLETQLVLNKTAWSETGTILIRDVSLLYLCWLMNCKLPQQFQQKNKAQLGSKCSGLQLDCRKLQPHPD